MGATEAITAFLADTSARDFPAGAVENAKRAIADTVAAMLAGAGSEVAAPLFEHAICDGSPGPVAVLGTGISASPMTAALLNGTLGHAIEYDDVLSMMPAHPSAVILAAVMSSLPGKPVRGADLIEAYVLGIEVGGKIGLAITQGHYRRGFHATGTLALFSAVAALAKLHRLDPPATRHALGLAASMASGLRCNFGTMGKPLHSGLAARSAVTAWSLARCGFTAAADALEAPVGFFEAYGVAGSDPDAAVRGLGRPFVIVDPGLALKKFPCCYAAHRAMDGVLELRAQLRFDAAGLERLVCRVPPGTGRVLTYPRPADGLEAKFSLEYALAAGVEDGKYDLATFADAAVRRPEIARLYERIETREDEACRGGDPHFEQRSTGSRGFVEVEVRLRDGRSGTARVEKAPGAPSRELAWSDIGEKFSDCARHSGRVSPGDAERAFAGLRDLDGAADVGSILELLRGDGAAVCENSGTASVKEPT